MRSASRQKRCHWIFTKRAGAKASDRRAFRDLKCPNKPLLGDSKATSAGKVAAHCGPLLSPWKKLERRDRSLAVLAVVCVVRRRSSTSFRGGNRISSGEARHRERLSYDSNVPRRSWSAGYALARISLFGCNPAFWAAISTRDILGSSRCPTVDNVQERHHVGHPLYI